MSEDWRVELDVAERGGAHRLVDSRRVHRVAREARRRLGQDMAVTVDDDRVFVYVATEADARKAESRLVELFAEHGLHAQATVTRWHPEERSWEPPDAPLPTTRAEHDAERGTLEARQASEAARRGYAEWEVRIELPDHDAAAALAARLRSHDLSVVCRAHVAVIATATEDEARSLAERVRVDVPEALSVTAEGSAAVAMDALDPFSVITGRWRSR